MSNSPTSNFHPDGTLFIVSGPSGAGKTTLIERASAEVATIGIELKFSVSHTTRPPRGGEEDGVAYHFVDARTFEGMVERGEFLEWARVHGHMYGTSRLEVETRLKRGEDVILDIDVQGAKQIADSEALRPRSLSVFVFPPSFTELESRIRGRKLNSEDEIILRLRKASAEIDGCTFYDYIIINDRLEVAVACLKAAIITRKLQSSSVLQKLREMAEQFKEENSGRFARGY